MSEFSDIPFPTGKIDVVEIPIDDMPAILRVAALYKFYFQKKGIYDGTCNLLSIKDRKGEIHLCYVEEKEDNDRVLFLMETKTKKPFLCLLYKDIANAITNFCCDFIDIECKKILG